MKRKLHFENVEESISIAAMLIMFVAIGINIVMNWVCSKRYSQLEELGTAAYMFACYAGFGLLYKRKELTSVTFLVAGMSEKLRWFAELLRYAYLIFFGAILTYQGIVLCKNSLVKKMVALQIPYVYLDICIVFGFAMLTIRCIKDLLIHFKAFKAAMGKETA